MGSLRRCGSACRALWDCCPLSRFYVNPQTGGVGQVALFRILACYLHLDREIGYCQGKLKGVRARSSPILKVIPRFFCGAGMGFLAAMLLCYMPEEDA